MLSIFALGYFCAEAERYNWDGKIAFDSLRARIVEKHYPQLKSKIYSLWGKVDDAPSAENIATTPLTNWLGLGDESYARARQVLLSKANAATPEDKKKLLQQVIDELFVTVENYQKALTDDPENSLIKDKIRETQKSIEVLKQTN